MFMYETADNLKWKKAYPRVYELTIVSRIPLIDPLYTGNPLNVYFGKH